MIKRLNKGNKQENHKDEIKLTTLLCSSNGNSSSTGVQLKLVETVGNGSSNVLNSGSISLTKKLKPNSIYYIKYNTFFGYEYGTNLFTYNYADTANVQGYSNMMVVEGDDEERACGYFEYECNNSVNTLRINGQIPADSLSEILTLEIYELTSNGTASNDDEVINISGDTDFYKYDDDYYYYDLTKKGNYHLTGFTANDIDRMFYLDFGFSKAFPTVGKARIGDSSFNQTLGSYDGYIFGCPNYGSYVSHEPFSRAMDIYIQVTDDTVLVFGHLEG